MIAHSSKTTCLYRAFICSAHDLINSPAWSNFIALCFAQRPKTEQIQGHLTSQFTVTSPPSACPTLKGHCISVRMAASPVAGGLNAACRRICVNSGGGCHRLLSHEPSRTRAHSTAEEPFFGSGAKGPSGSVRAVLAAVCPRLDTAVAAGAAARQRALARRAPVGADDGNRPCLAHASVARPERHAGLHHHCLHRRRGSEPRRVDRHSLRALRLY